MTLHIVFVMCQLCCAGFGFAFPSLPTSLFLSLILPLSRIYVVNFHSLPCVEDIQTVEILLVLLYVTILSQLIEIFGLVCCWTLYSSRRFFSLTPPLHSLNPRSSAPLGDVNSRNIHLTRESSFTITGQYSYEEARTKWSTRCKFLCKGVQCCTCNLIGGSGVQDDLDAGPFDFLNPTIFLCSLSHLLLTLVGVVLSDFFHHEVILSFISVTHSNSASL
jgi:hypothetical protein